MKSNIIRTISFLLAVTALSLTACAKSNFNYVETTVPATPVSVPWSNTSEFTYTPSEDRTDNVINWSFRSTNIGVMNGDLYLQRPGMAVRYDPKTGRQTYLCTDPLCPHDTLECPFSYTDLNSEYHVFEDKVLYYNIKDGMKVMLYSMTDRTVKEMRTVDSTESIPHLVPMKEWYYFIDLVYDQQKDTYIRSLCRQFYDSGKIEVLRKEDERRFQTSLMGTDGEVLYVYENHNAALVGLSLDGKTELFRTRFDYGFEAICKDGYMIYFDGETNEMWRKNLDGTDQHKLGISDVNYFYLTDSYIYYIKTDETKVFVNLHDLDDYTDDETFRVDYQTIYRSDHEGNNEEVVFKNTIGEDVIETRKYIVQGNYLYAVFDYYDINDEECNCTVSRQSESYTYCRIDCTTGEIYYIEVK